MPRLRWTCKKSCLNILDGAIFLGLLYILALHSVDLTGLILQAVQKWRNRLEAVPSETDCKQIKSCLEIGLSCIKVQRNERPTIKQITKMLSIWESTEEMAPASLQVLSERHHRFAWVCFMRIYIGTYVCSWFLDRGFRYPLKEDGALYFFQIFVVIIFLKKYFVVIKLKCCTNTNTKNLLLLSSKLAMEPSIPRSITSLWLLISGNFWGRKLCVVHGTFASRKFQVGKWALISSDGEEVNKDSETTWFNSSTR